MAIRRCHKVFVLAVFVCVFGFERIAEAVIYEWRDDRGGVYYADDVSKIPNKYRLEKRYRKVPELPSPSIDGENTSSGDTNLQPGVDGKGRGASAGKNLDNREVVLITMTIDVLRRERELAETIVSHQPMEVQGRFLVLSLQSFISYKRQLLDRIKTSEVESLKLTAAFLSASIEADLQERNIGPRFKTRLIALQSRLRDEMVRIDELLVGLQSDLDAGTGAKTPAPG